MSSQKTVQVVFLLCTLAGVIYNSWPLGYVLNNQALRSGLASDLERAGQPYYWLFILGDILTGVCTIAVCAIVWFKLRSEFHSKTWVLAYIGLFLFGLFTAFASLVPSHCTDRKSTRLN